MNHNFAGRKVQLLVSCISAPPLFLFLPLPTSTFLFCFFASSHLFLCPLLQSSCFCFSLPILHSSCFLCLFFSIPLVYCLSTPLLFLYISTDPHLHTSSFLDSCILTPALFFFLQLQYSCLLHLYFYVICTSTPPLLLLLASPHLHFSYTSTPPTPLANLASPHFYSFVSFIHH